MCTRTRLCAYVASRFAASVAPPTPHSSQAKPLFRANRFRDGSRRHHRPHHTDENDGDEAEDNDADVLLARWYSERDCW